MICNLLLNNNNYYNDNNNVEQSMFHTYIDHYSFSKETTYHHHHHHHHHHQVVLISTDSFDSLLSFVPIVLADPQNCIQCPHIAVFAGQSIIVCPWVGVDEKASLLSSSLLLLKYPACLVRLTRIVYKMGNK